MNLKVLKYCKYSFEHFLLNIVETKQYPKIFMKFLCTDIIFRGYSNRDPL